jgi:hypothetical protein
MKTIKNVPVLWEGKDIILIEVYKDNHSILNGDSINEWNILYPGYRTEYTNITPDHWSQLAEGFISLGIRCVAGQVASGSSIAYALKVMSKGELSAGIIKKESYKPLKHFASGFRRPYIIVDDLVASGEAMRNSCKESLMECGTKEEFCFAFRWNYERISGLGRMVTALVRKGD